MLSAIRPTRIGRRTHGIESARARGSTRRVSWLPNSVADLHSRTGDPNVFVDESGRRINGQWPGSPSPVEHDMLTGSNADGTLAAGLTCADWTSASAALAAQVGHSDGMGPNQSTAGALSSWNWRMPTRIAPTRRHAAARDASTASRSEPTSYKWTIGSSATALTTPLSAPARCLSALASTPSFTSIKEDAGSSRPRWSPCSPALPRRPRQRRDVPGCRIRHRDQSRRGPESARRTRCQPLSTSCSHWRAEGSAPKTR